MAIPSSSHPCWLRAASGGLAHIQTSNLALQLMAKRLERSTDPLPHKSSAVQAFFAKWERLLASELDQLARM